METYSFIDEAIAMNQCPCCTYQLLRQVRRAGIYWFCPYCRQEMPVLEKFVQGGNMRSPQKISSKSNHN